jgi:multidrug efflux system membrane fusion protein
MTIVFLIVALVAAVFMFTRGRKREAASAAAAHPVRPVPVVVAPAQRRDVPIVLEGLGTVTPFATVSVRAQVDGPLQSVAFREGAVVRKGQVLAQLDPRPFQISLAQASATLRRDQAQLRNALLDLGRYKGLLAKQLVPKQQVDTQQTAVDAAKATVAMDRAQVANAKLQLGYTRILSPLDGVAGIRQVDPGNVVRASDPTGLVVLTQLDPISVVFTLPQDSLERVQRAQAKGSLSTEAWSRDGRQRIATGQLKVIDNQVNAAAASVRFKATFANPQQALWPGAFVKARLVVEARQGVVVVEAAAVQHGPQGTFVYVVGADHTAQQRPVGVDSTEGTLAILSSGVQPGELVVTDGQNQLKSGAVVEARSVDAGTP